MSAVLDVAVVDEARCHRDGLCIAVAQDPRFGLVAEAATVDDLGDEQVGALAGLLLQAVAAGIDLVPGIARVRGLAPSCTVVVVVPWVDEGVVALLTEAGADAVITTDAPLADVLAALHVGHAATSSAFAEMADERARQRAGRLLITASELEVLRRLSEGQPPQGIAHDLHRSVSTVREHIAAVREKLDCTNAVELVVTAYRSGLLPGLGRPVDRHRRWP